MALHFGFTPDEWNNAKEEVRQLLVARAKHQETITYSEVVQQVHTIQLQPDSQGFHHMLGEISEDENFAGRGMLSAIVVLKETGLPGKGFFTLAEKLDRTVSDSYSFWIDELKTVYSYWSK